MSDKPLLVMLHGWGANAGVWDDAVKNLAQDFEVVTPELPGHGESRSPAGDIETVARLIAQQCDRPAIWLGWSLGALLALQVALSAADKVSSLLLVSATPAFTQHAGWLDGMPADQLEAFRRDFMEQPERILRRFFTLQGQGDADAKQVATRLNSILTGNIENMAARLQWGLDVLRDADLRQTITKIEQPTRLLHGINDAIVPAGAGRYLASVLGAEIQLWEEVGHAPFLSQPQHFIDWVRQAAA